MFKKIRKLIVNDLFTEFDFDKFSNSGKIEDSLKLEYIKEMIAFAKSDKQAIFMYFGFSIATIVFLIDKLDHFISKAGYVYLVLFYIGILLLLISSVSFFTYWRKIHKCHMGIISCIPNLNITRTSDYWVKLWVKNRKYFKIGLLGLTIGLLLIINVILIAKFNS